MDWPTHAPEIQARYFRTGSHTNLWIDYDRNRLCSLKWVFCFKSLGMYHTISHRVPVSIMPSGSVLVDGDEYATHEEAQAAVFAGHYADYVERFCREMGIEQ